MVRRAWLVLATMLLTAAPLASQTIIGDGIPQRLAEPGNPERGRVIIVDRQKGFCLLCHSGPFPEQRFMGNLAPSMAGAGTRYNEAQLRLRLVDSSRITPDTIMPAYFVTEGLRHVAPAFAGKPILNAQQIEDVIAFLLTLKEVQP